jgi:hypothetical protein
VRGTIAAAAFLALAALGAVSIVAPSANAQVDSSAALKVGDTAPDFSAPGATRYGLLRDPVALSDFSGKTVVLAFFYKARTKG